MAKPTWAEKWGSQPVDYNRPREVLEKELRKLRNLTARRTASLSKKNAFSYALYQYDQNMKKNFLVRQDVAELTRNQLEKELRIIHDFWSSKTSTYKGAREEQIIQSTRIFGKTKAGKPRRVLTIEEARKFWSVYDEFYNMYKEGTAKYDSNRVQQIIGEAYVEKDFSNIDMVQFLDEVRTRLEQDYEENTSLGIARKMSKGVYTGGNDFNF